MTEEMQAYGEVVVEELIRTIREQRVILDADIARLYGVSTKRLNEQIKRNLKRFPPDFAFQLSPTEYSSLRSQFATLKSGRGKHRKYLPLAFTEHGALIPALRCGAKGCQCFEQQSGS